MISSLKRLLTPSQTPLIISVRNNPFPLEFKHFLQNRPGTQYSVLSNGLTIATQERDTRNVCFGVYMDAGSRYESDFENGISYFFQHIAFKCTRSRNKDVLREQMANLGAKFRCITTRELVTYYVQCLSEDTPVAFDLLCDCVFNNSFSKDEIEYQKRIVYAEMLERDSDNTSTIYDYLHSAAFQGTPLGHTIMGPSTNLYNFNNLTICRYLSKCFDPSRTVIAASGGVNHTHLVSLATEYLCKLEPLACRDKDVYRYTASDVRYRDDSLPKAHVIVAVEGPSLCSKETEVMEVARHIIGGWDRSQPRGEGIASAVAREASLNNGCDAYKSFNIKYKDCGLWGVHYVASSSQLDDMILMIQDQWMYLCAAVTESEVQRGKRQLKMELLAKTQTVVGDCHELGRWTLYFGHRPSLVDRLDAIDGITARDVREVCGKYLYDRCPVVTAMGPVEGLLEYPRIRSWMYWLRV